MASNNIPFSEIRSLNKIIIENFQNQYQRIVDQEQISSQFILSRVGTLIGYEINTTSNTDFLKIRLYASGFINRYSGVNPFFIEVVQDQATGQGTQVFVSISDLPLEEFPVLSKTVNPIYDDQPGIYAIELETGDDYIQAETGEYLFIESQP